MKSKQIIPVLAIAIATIFVSCSKDGQDGATGPAGATGATGPAGPAGATGSTGTTNVLYSDWFGIGTVLNWKDSTMQDIGDVKSYSKAAVSVTQNIMDKGIVLAWCQFGVPNNPLPFTFLNLSPTVVLSFQPALNRIIFYYITSTGIRPSTNFVGSFRYVIIPGGTAIGGRGVNVGKVADINGQLYTESQLKAMPYNEVCSLLNIPK